MQPKRWQDWANGVLGVWMFAAPWILGLPMAGSTAAWTAWILGAAIILFVGLAVYLAEVRAL